MQSKILTALLLRETAMKKLILLYVFLLAGCVTGDPNPIATNLQEAQAKSDLYVCQASLRNGIHEKTVIKERKLNCEKIITAEYKRSLAASPSANVCLLNLERPDKHASAEIKKRGINCDKVLAAYYQEQQILAQQQAAEAQSAAASAAIANAFRPQPSYPTRTNCYTVGSFVNCNSY